MSWKLAVSVFFVLVAAVVVVVVVPFFVAVVAALYHKELKCVEVPLLNLESMR